MISISDACIACGICVGVCPANVLEIKGGKVVVVNESACIKCFACEDSCPTGAIKVENN